MEEQSQYEFSEKENILVGSLSKKMRYVGIIGIVFGILEIISGVFGEKISIFKGVISIIVGIWTMRASESFQKIVDTTGSDITNLLNALSEMKKLYTLQFWIFIIEVVFTTLVVFLVILGVNIFSGNG